MGVADPAPIAPMLTPSTARNAQFWLDAAQAAVRRHCGWHVAPIITQELVLNGSGSRVLLLPSGRVRTITALTNDGEDVLADAEWGEGGSVELARYWTRKLRGVTVTLEHGYSVVEAADVLGVIAAVAARSAVVSPGIAEQSVGPARVKYAVAPMLQVELETLAPYLIAGAG